ASNPTSRAASSIHCSRPRRRAWASASPSAAKSSTRTAAKSPRPKPPAAAPALPSGSRSRKENRQERQGRQVLGIEHCSAATASLHLATATMAHPKILAALAYLATLALCLLRAEF